MNNELYNTNKDFANNFNTLSNFSKDSINLLKNYCTQYENISKALQNKINLNTYSEVF